MVDLENLVIRDLNHTDARKVHEIALLSFKDIYQDEIPIDEIRKQVNKRFNPSLLVEITPKVKTGEMFFKIATIPSNIVGFCNIAELDGKMCLVGLFIHREYRRYGIGSRLLQKGEKFIIANGFDSYYGYVFRKNSEAIEFFKQKGFEIDYEKSSKDDFYIIKHLKE